MEQQSSLSSNMGTENYAALEQFERLTGLSLAYDRSGGPYTDVYGLAATLYYMVVGESPLFSARGRAETIALGNSIDQFMWEKLKVAGVSDRVREAIMGGMQVLPQDRFQAIGDFLAALQPQQSAQSKQTAMKTGDLLRNRYRIERALAKGGFGETYLAVDLDSPGQRQVVVKHLKPIRRDEEALKLAKRMFESEAKVLEELGSNSDRMPVLYAYFEEGEEFYLVQEFIAGQTLTAELAGRKLLESETIAVLQEILMGLAEVHSKNKIHRDLKPDNIIRRASDGKLVLIDFGAVKEVRQASLTTPHPSMSVSVGIGTRGYMPAEQAIGFPRPASDVYAVGAIGIQCLTGQHPNTLFDEDLLALRWQHLCRVNQDLAKLLERMVAQQVGDRFSNALEVQGAIKEMLAARQPKPTVQPSVPSQVVKPQPTPQPPTAQPPQGRSRSAGQKRTVANGDVASRRSFLKWLGFGGVGAASVFALSQLFKKSTTTTTPGELIEPSTSKSPSLSKGTQTGSALQLTIVQYTSVKLDSFGKVVARPTGKAEVFTEVLSNGVALTMVKIPAGSFMMGSPASEKGHSDDERPQRRVTVPEFYMGQTEVTQAQWQAIMGNNPAYFKDDDKLPVEPVTWPNAMDFCAKLSQKMGLTYRLPSEAEWEYACRAGTTTPFAFGETITPEVVNYNGNYPYGSAAKGEYRQKATPVGSFPANGFGLYDMHGNVWEWCLDEYFDTYNGAPVDGSPRGDIKSYKIDDKRLLRGGSWFDNAYSCRSANRNHDFAGVRYNNIGFRVVAVAPSTPSRQSS
jgi:eukaryotic-like serine/threonine-protein kinase